MKRFVFACACLFLLFTASRADALALTFEFSDTFSNTTVPGDANGPWLKLTFNDATAAAGYDVRLTMETMNLTGSEFISGIYVNLNPLLDVNNLAFNVVTNPDGVLSTISYGPDCCKADGDGLYDIRFNLVTAPPNFSNNKTVVVDINLTTGPMTALAFNHESTDDGGSGPFLAAAHLQSIATGAGSTWINGTVPPPGDDPGDPVATPEPASLILLGSGLAFVAGRVRRRRVRQ